jgi:hypothetical protein
MLHHSPILTPRRYPSQEKDVFVYDVNAPEHTERLQDAEEELGEEELEQVLGRVQAFLRGDSMQFLDDQSFVDMLEQGTTTASPYRRVSAPGHSRSSAAKPTSTAQKSSASGSSGACARSPSSRRERCADKLDEEYAYASSSSGNSSEDGQSSSVGYLSRSQESEVSDAHTDYRRSAPRKRAQRAASIHRRKHRPLTASKKRQKRKPSAAACKRVRIRVRMDDEEDDEHEEQYEKEEGRGGGRRAGSAFYERSEEHEWHVNTNRSSFARARSALQLSVVPDRLPMREAQHDAVYRWGGECGLGWGISLELSNSRTLSVYMYVYVCG